MSYAAAPRHSGDEPRQPSAPSAPSALYRAFRRVRDAAGVNWTVSEVPALHVPGSRGPACLVFDSLDAATRLWEYPADWRRLDDAELLALKDQDRRPGRGPRVLLDDDGVSWTVLEVGPQPSHREPELAGGWLSFVAGGGRRRRLAPCPDGWRERDDAELKRWLRAAHGRVRTKDS